MEKKTETMLNDINELIYLRVKVKNEAKAIIEKFFAGRECNEVTAYDFDDVLLKEYRFMEIGSGDCLPIAGIGIDTRGIYAFVNDGYSYSIHNWSLDDTINVIDWLGEYIKIESGVYKAE